MKRHFFIFLFRLLLTSSLAYSQGPWIRCSNGLPSNSVLSLTNVGNTIYAGTDRGGVFQSKDFGATWTATPSVPAFFKSQTWSMTAIDSFVFAAQRGGGVYRLSMDGDSWVEANEGLDNKMIQDIIAVGPTLGVATYGGGVFVSSDLGNSWSSLFENKGLDDMNAYSLSNQGSKVFCGTAGVNTVPDTGVVYRASLNGTSWERINNGLARNGVHLEGIFSMDANENYIYAGTDDLGLFRSSDGGNNWIQVHKSADIHAIKCVGSYVYYGTSYAGVFLSKDNGQTWTMNNRGLNHASTSIPYQVKDFLVLGDYIYTATDIGIFKQRLDGTTADVAEGTLVNESKDYVYDFPSPANRRTQVPYHLAEGSDIRLNIFDQGTGRLVYTTYFKQDAGQFAFPLDRCNLDNGMYVLVLKTDTKIFKKKLVVDNQ